MKQTAGAPGQRYVYVSDEDGHKFIIPIQIEQEFKKWAESDTESEDFDPGKYNAYAIDGHRYSFTDPRQDI